MCAEEEKISH